MHEAYILGARRTPTGKNGGQLADFRSDELLGQCLNALLEGSSVPPTAIGDVVGGCVTQVQEQGMNIIRQAVLVAGWPVSVPGVSLNRLCGSGQQAVTFAGMEVQTGQVDLSIGCGTESMSRVPMGADVGPFHPGLDDRFDLIPQGLSAELIAQKWDLSREAIDQFSYESHCKAGEAIREGRFSREISPIRRGEKVIDRDEGPRMDPSLEKMKSLKPAFKADGRISAGASSQISDGAAAVLLGNEAAAEQFGLRPRARIVATAQAGVDPTMMLTGPIPATSLVLKKAGLKLADIDLFEVNEAFASVVLAWQKELDIDPSKVNVNGGAIALGHPLGATGARLITTLLHELERSEKRYGLVTMCIGFGQGTATIIERL